jgi:hypothetical protein
MVVCCDGHLFSALVLATKSYHSCLLNMVKSRQANSTKIFYRVLVVHGPNFYSWSKLLFMVQTFIHGPNFYSCSLSLSHCSLPYCVIVLLRYCHVKIYTVSNHNFTSFSARVRYYRHVTYL